jgi:uncharacterized protein YrzB (UPF0473 family)
MDQNKNLEEQEVLVYTLTDEDGNESDFELLAKYEENGKLYYALVPSEAGEVEELEYVILEVVEEGDEVNLFTIEDEVEFDHIANVFDEMLNDEIDYDE